MDSAKILFGSMEDESHEWVGMRISQIRHALKIPPTFVGKDHFGDLDDDHVVLAGTLIEFGQKSNT